MISSKNRKKICERKIVQINLAQCVLEAYHIITLITFFKEEKSILISTLIRRQAVRNIFEERGDDKKHTHCSTFNCTWQTFLQTFLVEIQQEKEICGSCCRTRKKNYCRNLKLVKAAFLVLQKHLFPTLQRVSQDLL